MKLMTHMLIGAIVLFSFVPVKAESSNDPCELTISIPERVIDAQTVIFGEIHGTKEAPFAFLSAVCSALQIFPDKPLVIGLEYPSEQSNELQRFLSSDGSESAKAQLLASEFWQRSPQGGHASAAILDLIESLRDLIEQTSRISVVPFVGELGSDQFTRVANMANILNRSVEANEGASHLVLVGNLHARTKGEDPIYGDRNMAKQLKGTVISVNLASRYGNYWVCTQEGCGRRESKQQTGTDFGKLPSAQPIFVESEFYDLAILFDQFTASPPAASELVQ